MNDWELPITSNNAMAADFNAGDVSLASNICRIDSIRSLQRMSIENSNYSTLYAYLKEFVGFVDTTNDVDYIKSKVIEFLCENIS